MSEIEIRDYTKNSPKGRAAGRRCTYDSVEATTVTEAKAKATRTHERRIADGDLVPAAKSLGAQQASGTYLIDYRIL